MDGRPLLSFWRTGIRRRGTDMASALGDLLQNQQSMNTQLASAPGDSPGYLVILPQPSSDKITKIVTRMRYVNDSFCLSDTVKGVLGNGVILSGMDDYTQWKTSLLVTETTNNPNSTGSSALKTGMKLTVGATSVSLTKVTKHSSCAATKAYLTTSSFSPISSADFSGNDAVFSSVLSAATTYYILVDKAGASFNYTYTGWTYPQAKTTFTWIAGYNGSSDTSIYSWDITSVVVSGWGTTGLSTDTTHKQVGTGSVNLAWTTSGSNYILWNSTSFGDLSAWTGVSSGTPNMGCVGLWIYQVSAGDITTVILRIGSTSSNYMEVTGTPCSVGVTLGVNTGWMYYVFPLASGSKTGTPVWTTTAYAQLELGGTVASSNASFDYLTIGKSNTLGLNGLGDRRSALTIVATDIF